MLVGMKYEVELSPPLVVDNMNDGRLISVSPIASSPYLERGAQTRVIAGGGDRDLLHEFQQSPGAVPTKLSVLLYDYEKPFDFTLPIFITSSTSQRGQLTPYQVVEIEGLGGKEIRLSDTSLLASDFSLSYRLRGGTSFTRINKTAMPFTLPADVDAIRYRFRVPSTAGVWKYYGLEIGGVTRYFGVATNPDVISQTLDMEVSDTQTLTPFSSVTGKTIDFDFVDADQENYLSAVQDGTDFLVTALDTGSITLYVNGHPSDYSGEGERKAYRFTIRNKISNEQLVEGRVYDFPPIVLEVGETAYWNITGYVGNLTHTPTLTNSDTSHVFASVAKNNNEWVLTLRGIGTLAVGSVVEATIGVSQQSSQPGGALLTFDIPVKIRHAVTGSTTEGGSGLYSVDDLIEGFKLPKGLTRYEIDLSKYNWFDYEYEYPGNLNTLGVGTFSVRVSDPDLARVRVASFNPVLLLVITDTASTKSGICTVSLTINDDDGSELGTFDFDIQVPDITGRVVDRAGAEGRALEYPEYHFVNDPIIPSANFESSVEGAYDEDAKTLVVAEVHGFLGAVTKDELGRWNISERSLLETQIKEKLLDSSVLTRENEGELFGLLSEFANKDRVVRWPVETQRTG